MPCHELALTQANGPYEECSVVISEQTEVPNAVPLHAEKLVLKSMCWLSLPIIEAQHANEKPEIQKLS